MTDLSANWPVGQGTNNTRERFFKITASLTSKAAAAVSVGTYSVWQSTATLRLLRRRARGARAPTGEESWGRDIVLARAQLVRLLIVHALLTLLL